jgi:thiol-disulfide isomerase/thioredoxin
MQRRRLLRSGLLAVSAASAAYLATRTGVTHAQGAAAPGLPGMEGWLNAPAAFDPAVRRRATLVNFWTYSCINARRTLPYLRRWDAEYGQAGLQVLGIHTPEFGFEHDRANVEVALRELGIRYPVAQDNGYRTWRAWNNRAWPAFYLLDGAGRIVMRREGEGHSREMEAEIRGLLGLAPRNHPGEDADLSRIGSPEVYFGATHPTPQDPAQWPRDGAGSYTFGRAPPLNTYSLDGGWVREGEALTLRTPRGALRMRYSAAQLHVVAAAAQPLEVSVRVDGGAPRKIRIERPTLYTLVDGTSYGEHMLELEAVTPGLALYSATFG